MTTERGIWLADTAQRENLGAFVQRALRLDEAAVIRLRARGDDAVVAWAATGFEVLACRVVGGRISPSDLCAGADALVRAPRNADGYVDPGFAMDSAWRGALPPDSGFVHLDDVPAATLVELSQSGVSLAREHSGAHGPPPSLLDQEVLTISAGDESVGVPMRCVFALTAMGFLPEPIPADEVVRVRVMPAWLRIDARYGSVYRRRGGPMLLQP
jgi:hypothetical protein